MVFGSLFDKAQQKRDPSSGKEEGSNPGKQSRKRKGGKKRKPNLESSAAATTTQPADDDDDEFRSKKKRPRQQQHQKQQQQRPSKEAMALSGRLKALSTQKHLQQALDLYWNKSNDAIRDSHHACCVIDCAARCGNVAAGELVFENMRTVGMSITIETYTALLKGYAHAGMLHKGDVLFDEIMSQQSPNVRSLNTLLRGCLWTAATLEDGKLAGGVVTSSKAWKQSKHKDASSFEYYVSQLCQTFAIKEAEQEINRLKQVVGIRTIKGKKYDSFQANDASALESLAICLLALTRAKAILYGSAASARCAQSVIKAAEAARSAYSDGNGARQRGPNTQGGKRSWKREENNQRSASNSLFRSHRLREVENEANAIASIPPLFRIPPSKLCHLIMTRLFYFSGGGMTGVVSGSPGNQNFQQVEAARRQLLVSNWASFGLKAAVVALQDIQSPLINIDIPTTKQRDKIIELCGVTDVPILDQEGFLQLADLFDTNSKHGSSARPLDIEIGSGFGDWIVKQAKAKPERDYVAVEMRADRVAQTFSRLVLSEVPNLCCVGADALSFLQTRVRNGTVSTIFVNHPEPPTQTFGARDDLISAISNGGEEPAHMLHSDTIKGCGQCLNRHSGQLIIVTDNRFYARLICVSIVKAMKETPGLLEQCKITGMKEVESFGSVVLYEGLPSEKIRHYDTGTGSGQSYFDRLWKTGAGSHAERNRRFIVVMQRTKKKKRKNK